MLSLNTPVYKLYVPSRVRVALTNVLSRKRKPAIFGEALKLHTSELIREHNFGSNSLRAWRSFVERNGPKSSEKVVKSKATQQTELPLEKALPDIKDTIKANQFLDAARLHNRIGAAYAAIADAQTQLAKIYLGDDK